MANTTFKGTLRSEGGYSSIATTSGTGAETTQMSISSAGFTSLDANTMATEAGTGITGGTGTIYRSSVIREGGIIKTSILIDLTGRMTCFEAPAGGDPDINVHSATEGTGVEDGAISDLTETLLVNAGDATTGSVVTFTGVPAADEFLYLTLGATTDADYTAGKLLIELFGYEA
jgi:hypothetical protein